MEAAWTAIVNTCLAVGRAVLGGGRKLYDRSQAAKKAKVAGAAAWQPVRLVPLPADLNLGSGWVAEAGYRSFGKVRVTAAVVAEPKGVAIALLRRQRFFVGDRAYEIASGFGERLTLGESIGGGASLTSGGQRVPSTDYLAFAVRPPVRPWWARGSSTSFRLDITTESILVERDGINVREVKQTRQVRLHATIEWAARGD